MLYVKLLTILLKSFFPLRKENETRRRIAMKGVFARLMNACMLLAVGKYNVAGRNNVVIFELMLLLHMYFPLHGGLVNATLLHRVELKAQCKEADRADLRELIHGEILQILN